MHKFVITGGPSSGKTEVINELKTRGYNILPECALYLIKKEESDKGNVFPWTDLKSFQEMVYKLQIEWERNLNGKNIVILDRSLVDCFGFYLHNNMEAPSELSDMLKETKYELAFLLEMLPEEYWRIEQKGLHARRQEYANGVEIHKRIEEAYQRFGIRTLHIPFKTIKERADMVENYLFEWVFKQVVFSN